MQRQLVAENRTRLCCSYRGPNTAELKVMDKSRYLELCVFRVQDLTIRPRIVRKEQGRVSIAVLIDVRAWQAG